MKQIKEIRSMEAKVVAPDSPGVAGHCELPDLSAGNWTQVFDKSSGGSEPLSNPKIFLAG